MTDWCPHCSANILTGHLDWCRLVTGVPATLGQIKPDRCKYCSRLLSASHLPWCQDYVKPLPDFDGPGYIREYDLERLTTQKDKIFEVMKGGTWRTLGNISHLTGAPEASASAMLRAFRATKHGGHTVNRRRRGDPSQGWHEYQLIVKPVQLVLL